MNPEDVRAYARRAWHAAERLKREHWARETAVRGPLATFEASLALWEHMRPSVPTGRHRTSGEKISSTISGSSAPSIALRVPSTPSPIAEVLDDLQRVFARLKVLSV